ncbi:MAG: pseudouridine synthase [Spirochaetes bacterium]|nr:pseudouridine synthase [Spirochaetota bacterium]MBU0955844.1 pseudouridine synthase [Spirochaetota bacterium]
MSTLSLDKILQSQGIGSRKYCRAVIADGLVSIKGDPVLDWSLCFETEELRFSIDGREWQFHAKLYIVMNKPEACECSRKPSHHRSVLSLLPEEFINRDVQPVGRLDHDTTGLLLLSDDGKFIHAQSSPKKHLPKTYQATLARPCTPELVQALLEGVQLIDEDAPIRALSCAQTGELELELCIDQGKYHQVKRMIAAAGNHCAGLCRSAIGGLTLDTLGLAAGEWRLLTAEELALLAPY